MEFKPKVINTNLVHTAIKCSVPFSAADGQKVLGEGGEIVARLSHKLSGRAIVEIYDNERSTCIVAC